MDVTAVVKKDGSYTFRLSREAAAGIRKLSSKESPNRPYLEIVTE